MRVRGQRCSSKFFSPCVRARPSTARAGVTEPTRANTSAAITLSTAATAQIGKKLPFLTENETKTTRENAPKSDRQNERTKDAPAVEHSSQRQ